LQAEGITPLKLDESSFRLQLNNDAMATEKLAEGIWNFCVDTEKLELLLVNHLASSNSLIPFTSYRY
jgi:transaldolase